MSKNNILIIKHTPENTKKNDFDFLKSMVKFRIKFNSYKHTFFIELIEKNFKMEKIKKLIRSKFSKKLLISVLNCNKKPLELNEPSKILLVIFENLNDFNLDIKFFQKIVFLIDKPWKLIFFKKNDTFQAMLEFSSIAKTKIVKNKLTLFFKLLNIFVCVYYTKKTRIDIREDKPNEIEFDKSKEFLGSNKSIQDIKTQNDEHFIEIDIFSNLYFRNKNFTKIIYLKLNSKINYRKIYNHFKVYGKIEKIKHTDSKAVIFFQNSIEADKILKNKKFKIELPKIFLDCIHNYYLLFENLNEYYKKFDFDIYHCDPKFNEKIWEEINSKLENNSREITTKLFIVKWKNFIFNASNILVLENINFMNKLNLFNSFRELNESKKCIVKYFQRISSNRYLLVLKKEIHALLILKNYNALFKNIIIYNKNRSVKILTKLFISEFNKRKNPKKLKKIC